MHGIEEQTKESFWILRSRKTPFSVALNKVDPLYGRKSNPYLDIKTTHGSQNQTTLNDLDDHFNSVVQEFDLMELNAELFYRNSNQNSCISMVHTSANSSDGMGDLLVILCLDLQNKPSKRLAFSEKLHEFVMELNELQGLGTTISVIVVSGFIKESDTIVLASREGPIATQVHGLLQPTSMAELRAKVS
ncbi:Eukaryotic translation initiation factor 5B [Fasciolopsis buskii]|uniref:Eukaryotic translation initiation factor 5B n=1 Tax=Fasciolopsis buskii TaxID=27845 RepID=A0A8E0RSE4_9TREM|nr:Eukaryotic translation initiation factor 5B [Fasciolopsis buski]